MRPATRLGLAGVLLCALAELFATPALYVPGFAAVLAAVLAPAWVAISAARVRVALDGAPTIVYEGERLRVRVTVQRGPMPFPAATLLPLRGGTAVALPRRRRAEITMSVLAPRRGRHALGPALLRVADPLGLSMRELRSAERELLVLPGVYPVDVRLGGRLEDGGHARLRSRRDAALEPDSLRPYMAGTAASRIHWPTVARTGVLMERGLGPVPDARVLVMLDAQRPESEDALDKALRATASLCVHLARRGGCELLLGDDRRAAQIGADLAGWPALHARLAVVRAGGGVPRVPQLRHARTLLYVTAAQRSTPALSGRYYRVSPYPLAGAGAAFNVAGCIGQLIERRAPAGAP